LTRVERPQSVARIERKRHPGTTGRVFDRSRISQALHAGYRPDDPTTAASVLVTRVEAYERKHYRLAQG